MRGKHGSNENPRPKGDRPTPSARRVVVPDRSIVSTWPVCPDHLQLAINNGISLGHEIRVKLPDPVVCSACPEESNFEVVWRKGESL